MIVLAYLLFIVVVGSLVAMGVTIGFMYLVLIGFFNWLRGLFAK